MNSPLRSLCRRPSVTVCLSVTFVRPTQPVEIFGMFLSHLVPWPSVNIQVKFYGDHPRGTPPSERGRGLTQEGLQMAILDASKDISRKRCKIGGKLVLITSRKSHELSTGTKLGDLE